MVALSLHPSARHPKTEIHNKHNRAVETNNTQAERYSMLGKRGVHTYRDRALTLDASAQQSKYESMCVLTITQAHTSGSKSCVAEPVSASISIGSSCVVSYQI